MTLEKTPRIYVACLAAYNNGILHGDWINCDQDEAEIWQEIQRILKSSPITDAEEWAIHDYENWHSIRIEEYESIKNLAGLAKAIKEHGAAIAYFYGRADQTADIEEIIEEFGEKYIGCYESEEDFCRESLEDQGIIAAAEKAGLKEIYIDFEAMARDWFINDFYSEREEYEKIHIYYR
jgi:antirestriction protein